MTARTHELPEGFFNKGPLWAVGFVALWVFAAILFVHEYVGDSIRFSTFATAYLAGMVLGVGLWYWFRRTKTGMRIDSWFRTTSTSRMIGFAVVTAIPIAAMIYLAARAGISSLSFQAGLLGAAFASHLFDVGLVHLHTG